MPRISAAVCNGFGQPLAIEELDLRAPQAGEVEVTIEACAVCHSDIAYAAGAWGGETPLVLGHEAAGRVSKVGRGVGDIALGDLVAHVYVHELAHHFGWSDDDIAAIDRWWE